MQASPTYHFARILFMDCIITHPTLSSRGSAFNSFKSQMKLSASEGCDCMTRHCLQDVLFRVLQLSFSSKFLQLKIVAHLTNSLMHTHYHYPSAYSCGTAKCQWCGKVWNRPEQQVKSLTVLVFACFNC